MGFMGRSNGQAINFSIKIAGKFFNFKNGCTLNIERNLGDTMNKFSLTVIDGSSKTAENIDMLFNNGGQNIDLKYGYGSNLVSMSGFIVDYKHTFVGDVYKLDMSGYVSLSSVKNIYSEGVYKYYIDWGPCIPKRVHEGMQWDAFYNAIQSDNFFINKTITAKNTDDSTYKKYLGLRRFSSYYSMFSSQMQSSLEAEQRYNQYLEEAIKAKNEVEAGKIEGGWNQFWHNIGTGIANGVTFNAFDFKYADEFNEEIAKYSSEFADYAGHWQDLISQYSAANNIVALKIEGPKGSCYIPYPDLFISFDNTPSVDLDPDTAMCDSWAFGLQTKYEKDDKTNKTTKFWIDNDWAEMVKGEWKLRVLTIKDNKYIWVGDVPAKIDQVTEREGPQHDSQLANKKRWLTAAYNAAAPIRDAGIRVSDIVKNLCDLEGWKYDETTIVDTSYTNAADDNLRMNGEGAFEYIVEKLCPIAVDTAGSSYNYKAWFDNQDRFHFEPLTIGSPGNYIDIKFGYNIKDSPVLAFQVTTNGKTIASYRNDALSGINSASGEGTQVTSTARDFKSALVLAYEKDPKDTSLIFNEALYNTLGFNSSKASYDYYKNEVMSKGEIKGNFINIKSQNEHTSSVASSGQAKAKIFNDMAHFEEKLIQAEMTIVGDPRVQPGRWCRVTNMVKGGRRHYTSGGAKGYWIQSVVDTISSDGFTQKCKMIRWSEDSYYFQENKSYDDLMRGTGESFTTINYDDVANSYNRNSGSSSGSSGSSGPFSVGDTVYISTSATTYTTGQTIAGFAKNRPSQIKSISNGAALITYNGTVVGWVALSDLVKTSTNKVAGETTSFNASGSTIEQKTWNALRGAGYSPISCAAAMGNIQAESGFNSNVIEKTTAPNKGFGLCQWTGGRRTQLENFARSRGVSPCDVDLQLEFLLAELDNGNGYATRQLYDQNKLKYEGQFWKANQWKNPSNLADATTAFMACFERPNQDPNINHISKRKQYAQGFYNKYAT